jgi:tetratricopeptide (TPR) repeat protein
MAYAMVLPLAPAAKQLSLSERRARCLLDAVCVVSASSPPHPFLIGVPGVPALKKGEEPDPARAEAVAAYEAVRDAARAASAAGAVYRCSWALFALLGGRERLIEAFDSGCRAWGALPLPDKEAFQRITAPRVAQSLAASLRNDKVFQADMASLAWCPGGGDARAAVFKMWAWAAEQGKADPVPGEVSRATAFLFPGEEVGALARAVACPATAAGIVAVAVSEGVPLAPVLAVDDSHLKVYTGLALASECLRARPSQRLSASAALVAAAEAAASLGPSVSPAVPARLVSRALAASARAHLELGRAVPFRDANRAPERSRLLATAAEAARAAGDSELQAEALLEARDYASAKDLLAGSRRAICLVALGEDLEAAAAELRASTNSEPSNASLHLWLGKAYLGLAGKYKEDRSFALSSLMAAVKADPQLAEGFTLLGGLYASLGDAERSRKCLTRAFALDAGEATAGESLFDALVASGERDAAERLAREAVARLPSSSWAWQKIGSLELGLGREAEAEAAFQQAIRNEGMASKSSLRAAWGGLGRAYAASGKYVAAVKALERSIDMLRREEEAVMGAGRGGASSMAALVYELASVRLVLGLEEQALEGLRASLALDPGFLPARLALADATVRQASSHLASGQRSTAAAELARARSTLAELPRNLFSVAKASADALLISGQPAAAAAELSRALHLHPDRWHGWHDLGLALWRAGRLAPAERALRSGLALEPKAVPLWCSLALVLCDQGKLRSAQHCLVAVLEEDPKHAAAWEHLGYVYTVAGRADLAGKVFANVQALHPLRHRAWAAQGLALSSTDAQAARVMFSRSMELGPSDAAAVGLTLASITLADGPQADAARLPLQHLVEREPGEAWAHNSLGVLRERTGLLGLAVASFRAALGALGGAEKAEADAAAEAAGVRANLARALGRVCAEGGCDGIDAEAAAAEGASLAAALPTGILKAEVLRDCRKLTESLAIYDQLFSRPHAVHHRHLYRGWLVAAHAAGPIPRDKAMARLPRGDHYALAALALLAAAQPGSQALAEEALALCAGEAGMARDPAIAVARASLHPPGSIGRRRALAHALHMHPESQEVRAHFAAAAPSDAKAARLLPTVSTDKDTQFRDRACRGERLANLPLADHEELLALAARVTGNQKLRSRLWHMNEGAAQRR